MIGIDVSRYQRSVDWEKVARAGIAFAYMKLSRSLSSVFVANWSN